MGFLVASCRSCLVLLLVWIRGGCFMGKVWGGLFFPRPVKEVSDAITLKGCMRGLYLKQINSMI